MNEATNSEVRPGLIALFGSGETSPSGRKIFDYVLRRLPPNPRLALLETPAGFELNSAQVIGRVADFIRHRLQNYQPRVEVIPARKRGTPFSPDNPDLIAPLYQVDMIFMGPGSPTYAVRQLKDSLAWQALLACHRLGTAVVFASAATVAASVYALPVYEIYKVGEDLHWKEGLDFFGAYGLPLVFIPHWNNTDGGDELDTSRCFMGKSRFAELIEMIPSELTVVGIDEMTALIVDPQTCSCRVIGLGGVTLIHVGPSHRRALAADDLREAGLDEIAARRQGHVHRYVNGEVFSLNRIGPFRLPVNGEGLPAQVWQQALQARAEASQMGEKAQEALVQPPAQVLELVQARQQARQRQDWATADRLRQQIARLGWQVLDTPQGPKLVSNQAEGL